MNKQRKNVHLSFRSDLKQNLVILILVLVFSSVNAFIQAKENRFVPNQLPAGFVFAHSPEFYGTYEKPQENGTIYDYINGGGEVYIKHGFRNVTHIILTDKAQNTITLDIYNMATQGNAKEAFGDETICPEGFTQKNIGKGAKVYHYEPDFFIYFVKGKYLVYLALSNDALSGKLIRFAADIYKYINE
jgi:hypothetical protein